MRLASALSLLALVGTPAFGVYQVLFTQDPGVEDPPSQPIWDQRPSEDATGNLIFQSLASHADAAHGNSRYPFGHSIVRASILPGMLLYHGRGSYAFPEAGWLAFDPEHSGAHLVDFDGCSADKAEGVHGTQDILIWGKLGHDAGRGPGSGEQVRFVDACEWAKQFDVDGFIRMELDFEIMYCDFTRGLEFVSALNIIYSPPGGPDNFTFTLRIQSRRALTREQYRLQNVSSADIARAREDIAQLFSRPRMSEAACQTSWPSRRQCRIAVLQQSIISLIAYMPRAGVGEPAWFAETAQRCRASFTGHLPVLRFTKQEHVLHNALDKVLQEVCRVLTSAWSETFDVEDKSVDVAAELLVKWKDEVGGVVRLAGMDEM
ncbi:hypothetical protein FOMPIDRAFT_1049425 [Fomitopsis schrenkii]|uniref:Uncharacterized protein n=1 Tax=Fomitopsis schrenkii TaxID=2126942 RepID=S8FQU0_FOMSC|nr:hypothetical protein FOMPIDRAFT_1049425 [Fomitopsis schrenkii]